MANCLRIHRITTAMLQCSQPCQHYCCHDMTHDVKGDRHVLYAGKPAAVEVNGTTNGLCRTLLHHSAAGIAAPAPGSTALLTYRFLHLYHLLHHPLFSHPSGLHPAPCRGLHACMHAGTISSHPSETAAKGTFTISIKKDGLVSSHMHAVMQPGMALRFRGVDGTFTPVPNSTAPALLVAGGIGKHQQRRSRAAGHVS